MDTLQIIENWNTLVGNTCEKRDIYSEDVVASKNLVMEEIDEFHTAWANNNRAEILDSCADIIFTIVGLLHRMGYSSVDVLKVVNDSNYSKFVDENNQEEVDAVFDSYYEDPRYTNISIHKGVIWGTVRETGSRKILKGVNYHPPRWEELGDDV